MFGDIISQYLGKFSELGKENARALHDYVEKSAKALGIAEPITLLRSDSKEPNLLVTWLQPVKPAANTAKNIPTIIITDGALDLLGGNALGHTISDELKAAVGHEMSHIREGFAFHNPSIKAIYALPLAFAAGYYILDAAYRKKEHSEENLSLMSAIKQVVVDERLGLASSANRKPESGTELKEKNYEQLLRVGGTVAFGALGFASALGYMRNKSMLSEFRADRTGAWLAGSTEAQLSAVKKIMGHLQKNAEAQRFCGSFITTSPTVDAAFSNLWQRIKSYYHNEMTMLDLEYAHAHPTYTQRETNLAVFKKSPEFQARVAQEAAEQGAKCL